MKEGNEIGALIIKAWLDNPGSTWEQGVEAFASLMILIVFHFSMVFSRMYSSCTATR
jgi:hypothetical protein